jgi:fermentation-respiration switch protein FrsA (DUF1100 family)
MLQLVPLPVLKWVFALAGLVGVVYASACLFLFIQQTRMIFFPSSQVETTPADLDMPYQNVWLSVAEAGRSQRLHGWWIPAKSPEIGVVLHLHGNAMNVGANVGQASHFHQLGLSVLLIDYRGYGWSEGNFPHEAQVYQDARTAWNYLTQERGVPPEQIILYGHSLGGAIAIHLATHHADAAGLIVQSSFTSIRHMIDRTMRFGVFPIKLLLTQQFDSLSKVPSLQMPILFVHGSADARVPADMSETLYAAAPEPKQLYIVPAADHNNVADTAGMEYLHRVQRFALEAIASRTKAQK